jgi:antirestriction protein
MKPQVYVGTYAKYNAGSILGAWVDLSSFDSADSFIDYCKELHKDEPDPELMFQDYEGFPSQYYHESEIHPDLWDEFLKLDDNQREIMAAYIECTGDTSANFDDVENSYFGKWDDFDDFAFDYVASTGMLANIPDEIARYFDYSSFSRDLSFDYMQSSEGHIFSNY